MRFAVLVAQRRGRVADAELVAVRAAGYTDAEIIEIVENVALNVWTNYIIVVADTEIDFPVVSAEAAA